MQGIIVSGIQQLGIGVQNVNEAWKWYRKYLGMDIKVFEESATASLMLPYTGGVPQKRHAVLALNLSGGGGFEIWQYTDRVPQAPGFVPALGDLGIFAAKIKARDIQKTYAYFTQEKLIVSQLTTDPAGRMHFFLTDPFNNIFQIIESHNWFAKEKKLTGSVYGVIIGVTDIEKSMQVYSDILGYDKVLYDLKDNFNDFAGMHGGDSDFRRVLLKNSKPRLGAFGKLFGDSEIELVQVEGHTPRKIYEDRFWGDLGFIHLCFDIQGMEKLNATCAKRGFPFTVDSFANDDGNSFDMGEAAGHFSYIEDPDGTLIEFVETHKVPILKKFGWYLNLRKRNPAKHLPDYIVKMLGLGKVKD
ncbi:MAG: VOC family protein [Lentimicrobiaceae bacterium]|jgi:catechol 2,3-dioxygenase-like lactoylglutathione lyase family enzyme